MKIAVIAANGKSGQAFISVALKAGHTITAGVHHTNSLPNHPNLSIKTCDATNPNDLRKLLKDHDAVASFIGHVRGSDADVQSAAIAQIIAVMGELGLKRIVSMTGSGVRFPNDAISFMDYLLNTSIRLIDPKRIHDGIQHVALLKDSNLDWTVIRVLKLTHGARQPFSLDEHGPAQWFTSRETVAAATLQVLEQHSFASKAPMIGPLKRA